MDYLDVTELAGDSVSQEQLDRICHRYYWAMDFCRDKDIVEVACGTGQGLGPLKAVAKSLVAGDVSNEMLKLAKAHYKDRVSLIPLDAQALPFPDQSKDVIILFEAIYYLPEVKKFFRECQRVLRPGGMVLISTANKDLFDFNPSPYSFHYYGVTKLKELFEDQVFSVEIYGYCSVNSSNLKEKIFRVVKKTAVWLHLIPQTMKGKRILKRLVFGRLVKMPPEIPERGAFQPPLRIQDTVPDRLHKVIYCVARMKNE